MDVRNNNVEEICRNQKKAKICDESRDFISGLPNSILVHILTFLPIKDAIRTVLIRKFGNLWRSVPVLDFNSCLYHDCDVPDFLHDYFDKTFLNVIHRVLNLHDNNTLDKLCLKFGFILLHSKDEYQNPFYYYDELKWEKGTADLMEKLICYAISKRVKVLDLNLKGCIGVDPSKCYDLPDVLSSNYLTYLKLAAFDMASCRIINLKSLSVLSLDKVTLSDDVMETIFAGCPSLENMSLIDCFDLHNINCKNPNLKKVMLSLTKREDWPVNISCPYVLSLEINGWIERACLLDVSSVVDAAVFFCYLFSCEQKPYEDVRRLLLKVSQCKSFSPCTWTVLVLTIWNFTNVACPTFEWKNLILKLRLTKWHYPGLSLLLRCSQSLEKLTMFIYPSCINAFEREEAQFLEAHEFDGEKYWDSQVAHFPYLETVMIYGYVDEAYVIQMVKFLLTSAPRLQKLVVSTKKSFNPVHESCLFRGPIESLQSHFTLEQLQELSQQFKSLPRASPEATIYFE